MKEGEADWQRTSIQQDANALLLRDDWRDDYDAVERLGDYWKTGRSIHELHVVEQIYCNEDFITLIELKGKKLVLRHHQIRRKSEKEYDSQGRKSSESNDTESIDSRSDDGESLENEHKYEYEVKSIQRISKNSFVIHQSESDNVRLLTVDIQGDSKYQDKVIYIDATHKIEKILADKNNLYILSESGKEQFFKTFILKPNLELIPTGTILNLEVQNAGFFNDFKRSNMINGDILVMSD